MSRTALTYRDYEALPNDGRRYEIHDGELSVTPSPSLEHQVISARLFTRLTRWLQTHPGGLLLYAPLDVILADRRQETSIVQPDILYLAPDRLGRASPRGIEGGPTLAIPYLWLVDPDARAVEVFAQEGDRYVLAAGAAGPDPVDLPPFTDVGLVAEALWP